MKVSVTFPFDSVLENSELYLACSKDINLKFRVDDKILFMQHMQNSLNLMEPEIKGIERDRSDYIYWYELNLLNIAGKGIRENKPKFMEEDLQTIIERREERAKKIKKQLNYIDKIKPHITKMKHIIKKYEENYLPGIISISNKYLAIHTLNENRKIYMITKIEHADNRNISTLFEGSYPLLMQITGGLHSDELYFSSIREKKISGGKKLLNIDDNWIKSLQLFNSYIYISSRIKYQYHVKLSKTETFDLLNFTSIYLKKGGNVHLKFINKSDFNISLHEETVIINKQGADCEFIIDVVIFDYLSKYNGFGYELEFKRACTRLPVEISLGDTITIFNSSDKNLMKALIIAYTDKTILDIYNLKYIVAENELCEFNEFDEVDKLYNPLDKYLKYIDTHIKNKQYKVIFGDVSVEGDINTMQVKCSCGKHNCKHQQAMLVYMLKECTDNE